MTVFFDFEKENEKFTVTLAKHGKIPRQQEGKTLRALALDEKETKVTVKMIKEIFPGEGLRLKKVDPDIFEIQAQRKYHDACYRTEDDDWVNAESVAKWAFGIYCGKHSCKNCPFDIAPGTCVPAKVFKLYGEE